MNYADYLKILCRMLCDVSSVMPPLSSQQLHSLLQVAENERVLTLVWQQWQRRGLLAGIPEDVRNVWQRKVYRVLAQIALLQRTNQTLLASLAQQLTMPLKLTLIKGAAFQAAGYPHSQYRPLSDVDWWVMPADIPRVKDLLAKLGYQPRPAGPSRSFNALLQHEIGMEDASQQVCVEVHWGLLSSSGDRACGDVGWFWQHTQPFAAQPPDSPLQLALLTPTANFLYLAAHYELQQHVDKTKHTNSGRLLWLYDLHQLLSHADGALIDWAQVLDVSRQWYWVSLIKVVLERLHTTFGSPLPTNLLSQVAAAERASDRRLYQRRAAPGQLSRYYQWYWFADQPLRAKLEIMQALLFPPVAYMSAQYAGSKLPLPMLYGKRWFDFVWRMVR